MARHLLRNCLAGALLSTATPALAGERPQTCLGDPGMCSAVSTGERALTAMMMSGDAGAVQRLFADDAVWSLGDGTRQTKAEAIAALRKAPRMVSSQLQQLEVRQFGTVAIALWKESWRAPSAGQDEVSFGTDTWTLRAGRWQIIASQEAHAPTGKAR